MFWSKSKTELLWRSYKFVRNPTWLLLYLFSLPLWALSNLLLWWRRIWMKMKRWSLCLWQTKTTMFGEDDNDKDEQIFVVFVYRRQRSSLSLSSSLIMAQLLLFELPLTLTFSEAEAARKSTHTIPPLN